MSNNKFHRRRWSFEKGRHSSSAVLALLTTAAVTAVVLCSFRYDYHTAGKQRQTTDVSLISGSDQRVMDLLERFDPAHLYGINNGGQPFCLTCRRSHHPDECASVQDRKFEVVLEKEYIPAVPEYRHKMPDLPDEMKPLPPAVVAPPVLPFPSRPPEQLRRTQVIAGDGKIVPGMEKIAALKVTGKVVPGVIRLSGRGLLTRTAVVRSCGDGQLDKQAENILKAAGLSEGIYTVNWVTAEKENE